jgi:HEAT repeat protein
VVLGLCGLAVVAVVAWKSWRIGLEHWYIAKLESEDPATHENAVARLREMGSVRAVPYLIEAMAGRHGEDMEPSGWTIPSGPALETVFSGSGAVISGGVITTTSEGDDPAWTGLSEAILAAGLQALPRLLEKLRSIEPMERMWAAYQIGRLGPEGATASSDLFASLSDDDRLVRRWAARAMASIAWRSPAVVDSLGEALRTRGNSRELRESSLEALMTAARMFRDRFRHVRYVRIQEMPDPAELEPEAARTLSAVLGILHDSMEEEDERLRLTIVEGLLGLLRWSWLRSGSGKVDLPFEPHRVLLRLAADRDTLVRADAVRLLGEAASRGKPTLSAIARALHDPQDVVRDEAEAALRRGAASGMGVPELASALKSPRAAARRGAAAALGYYGTTAGGAGPALLEALDDEDPSVREAAALSIVSTRGVPLEPLSEKAVPVLAGCLSDEDPLVRRRAGEALRNLGPAARAAVPALIGALRNEKGQVNDWALLALGAIGPDARAAGPAVQSILAVDDGQDHRDAFRVLKSIGAEPDLGIPVLRRLLVEPHDLYAEFAADALTAFGERAVPTLVEALSSENHRVRGGAIGSLGDLAGAGKPALPALAKVEAEDPLESLRVQARLAIERITAGREF